MNDNKNIDDIIFSAKKIHMIGIGGSGMCPIAEILHSKGYTITGSDVNEGDTLNRIKNLGIEVFMGQTRENITNQDLVCYSAAIHEDNPEIVEAKAKGIQTVERSIMLGAITRKFNKVIGVCGTHGKTTTSSMLTQIFVMANLDPTAVIGGKLPLIASNGIAGKSDFMICESCEFVNTFLELSPNMAVLLNVDNDHLDFFKTMENLTASFKKFVDMASIAIVNGDDERAIKIAKEHKGETHTFGKKSTNEYYAENITDSKFGKRFCVMKSGEKVAELELSIPGEHNVYNALAAFAAACSYGVSVEDAVKGIESFGGAGRRFEKLGEYNGIMIADDYAHHPTEIKATLKAAKSLHFKRVIAVFQPFTFSRTALLKDEFIEALSVADKVVLTPIMGSREVNEWGISSNDLAVGLKDCTLVNDFDGVAKTIMETAKPGDIVVTMGGGDIYKAAHKICKKMQEEQQ